VAAGWVKFAA